MGGAERIKAYYYFLTLPIQLAILLLLLLTKAFFEDHLLHQWQVSCTCQRAQPFYKRTTEARTLSIELVQMMHRVSVVCKLYAVHIDCVCNTADSAPPKQWHSHGSVPRPPG